MTNNLKAKNKCLVLHEIDYGLPRNTRKLIFTSNPDVFNYYHNNIELHPDEDKVNRRFKQFKRQNYKSQTTGQIFRAINRITWVYKIKFFRVVYVVGPGIYPSNQFRSSKELHKLARSFKAKRVLDYGCSNGFVGLACNDSKSSTFVDINPEAIKYVKRSAALQNRETSIDSHVGNLPKLAGTYDVVFFNPPFHLEDTESSFNACLRDDSKVRIVENFWEYIKDYTHSGSEIYTSFSNKDPLALQLLESSMAASDLTYELAVHKYKNTRSDVRVYKIVR